MLNSKTSYHAVPADISQSNFYAIPLKPPMPTLHKYQQDTVNQMVDFLNSPTCGCYNAAEMGLGKSAMALRAIEDRYRGFCPATLIICPKVVKHVWEAEIALWMTKNKHTYVVNTSADITQTDEYLLNDFVIISYDLAAKPDVASALASYGFTYLILDEAHYLRNPNKRSRSIINTIWPAIPYRICLSGTPLVNGALDGYNLFHALAPTIFPSKSAYSKSFTNLVRCRFSPSGYTYEGVKNPDLLRELVTKHFFIRLRKDDCLPELPPKVFQVIPLPESYKVTPADFKAAETLTAQQIDSALFTQLSSLIQNKDLPPSNVRAHITTIRRYQGLKKLPAIVDYAKDLLEQKIPVVIFGCFHAFINGLASALHSYEPAIITGETTDNQRRLAVENFQSGATDLILLNNIAGGVGITLTRSSVCIIGEADYSPANLAQDTDRLHRIGQKSCVQVIYFAVKGSVDEQIWSILSKKSTQIKEFVDGEAVYVD